jgi:hypothetical protein
MRANLSCFIVAVASSGLFACGGGSGPSGSPPAAEGDDGGNVVTTPVEAGVAEAATEAAAPVDHGAPSTTYPAFTPSFPQVQNNGGLVMAKPTIVSITWDADPSQSYFDAFADTLGGTSYWNATTSEYGVGPVVSGTVNHVHNAGTPPTTLQDSDLQALVQANAGNTADGGAGWPAPTSNTIYAFFLPPGTSLNLGSMGGGGPGGGSGDACSQGVGGYHDQVAVGSVTTSYAVVPSCTFGGGNTAAQQTTMSMSHEIIEASTDPQPESNNPGYIGFDNDHFGWDYFQSFQDEVGDACELYLASFYEEVETAPAPFDYWVQRTWSNKAGPAGHDPCVPAPAQPYFNVTPLDLQTVNVSLPAELTGAASTTTEAALGYKVLAGQSGKFALGFYSDAATSGAWSIKASAGNPLGSEIDQYNKSAITVSLDKTSGVNGEKAYLTVNVTTTGPTFKGELVTITSTLSGVQHYMPIWIAGQ